MMRNHECYSSIHSTTPTSYLPKELIIDRYNNLKFEHRKMKLFFDKAKSSFNKLLQQNDVVINDISENDGHSFVKKMINEVGNNKDEIIKLMINAVVEGICERNCLKEEICETTVFAEEIASHVVNFSQMIDKNKTQIRYSSSMLQLALCLC